MVAVGSGAGAMSPYEIVARAAECCSRDEYGESDGPWPRPSWRLPTASEGPIAEHGPRASRKTGAVTRALPSSPSSSSSSPSPSSSSSDGLLAPGGPPVGDVVRYGPGIPGEDALKLLGHLDGRRVLELGCSPGGAAVTMARAGAKVIVVDESDDALAATREAAARHGVRVETRHGPLAELAFVRAETIDVAVSIYGLAAVDDVDRVFRQVHRVLRPERPLVFSLPHPALVLLDPDGGGTEPRPRRRWWDDRPLTASGPLWPGEGTAELLPRTLQALFTSLGRANFRVDVVAEPPAEPQILGPEQPDPAPALDWVPPTLILRARKQGL
jgi:SAM-dependent methyltransferase